ncbi:hypothetical protein NDU88_002964 [Pleurodeles waltl]|uniref:Uncharacterized protein n=1 Tax=Pleurodeles waltl TaxID=8319 RepID=A0AAV7MSX0_PLEWA|nr:hypothetical protein NDU88_002964 [Pleurodeles waltl]
MLERDVTLPDTSIQYSGGLSWSGQEGTPATPQACTVEVSLVEKEAALTVVVAGAEQGAEEMPGTAREKNPDGTSETGMPGEAGRIAER